MLQETCGCTVKLCKKEGFPYWDKYDFLCIETTHINYCWFGDYAPLDCRWAWCYMDSRAKVQAAKNATVCLNAVYTCTWFTLEDEIVGDTFLLIKRSKESQGVDRNTSCVSAEEDWATFHKVSRDVSYPLSVLPADCKAGFILVNKMMIKDSGMCLQNHSGECSQLLASGQAARQEHLVLTENLDLIFFVLFCLD